MSDATDWKFEPTDPECDLRTFVGEAIGAASVCWDSMEGRGVFMEQHARAIVDAICERANAPEGARLGMATTFDLLLELETRLTITNPEPIAAGAIAGIRENLPHIILSYRTVDNNE